jgi:hypothetical protein
MKKYGHFLALSFLWLFFIIFVQSPGLLLKGPVILVSTLLTAKGIKRSKIFRLFQVHNSCINRCPPKKFSAYNRFCQKICKSLTKIFYLKLIVGPLFNTWIFEIQRRIALLLIPFVDNFEEIFFNSYRERWYFFGGKKVKSGRNCSAFQKCFLIN